MRGDALVKKWYKSWKVWRMFIVVVTFTIVIPFIINEAYKKGSGYVTVWTGSEFLNYYGTILGAVATIIALVGTILFTRRQILFERYVQCETEKWKEIERLFRDAIVLAEPVHLTTMFYNSMQNKTLDVCLELETYLTKLSEAIDRLNITIEEKDASRVNELLEQLQEIADEDGKIAKDYDTVLTTCWLLRGYRDDSGEKIALLMEQIEQGKAINLRAKNLREQQYRALLKTKKQIFAEIYNDLDKNAQKILIFSDEVINET